MERITLLAVVAGVAAVFALSASAFGPHRARRCGRRRRHDEADLARLRTWSLPRVRRCTWIRPTSRGRSPAPAVASVPGRRCRPPASRRLPGRRRPACWAPSRTARSRRSPTTTTRFTPFASDTKSAPTSGQAQGGFFVLSAGGAKIAKTASAKATTPWILVRPCRLVATEAAPTSLGEPPPSPRDRAGVIGSAAQRRRDRRAPGEPRAKRTLRRRAGGAAIRAVGRLSPRPHRHSACGGAPARHEPDRRASARSNRRPAIATSSGALGSLGDRERRRPADLSAAPDLGDRHRDSTDPPAPGPTYNGSRPVSARKRSSAMRTASPRVAASTRSRQAGRLPSERAAGGPSLSGTS